LLYPEIEEMYWDGVRKEVEVLLITLKQWQEQWQEQANGDIPLPGEIQVDLHEGFDTFIDQVTEESRSFARRAGRFILYLRPVGFLDTVQSGLTCALQLKPKGIRGRRRTRITET
jgi:hypothetical protein